MATNINPKVARIPTGTIPQEFRVGESNCNTVLGWFDSARGCAGGPRHFGTTIGWLQTGSEMPRSKPGWQQLGAGQEKLGQQSAQSNWIGQTAAGRPHAGQRGVYAITYTSHLKEGFPGKVQVKVVCPATEDQDGKTAVGCWGGL